MQIIENLSQISEDIPILLTIGNFDGVHLGHSGLIEEIKERTQNNKFVLVVTSFWPHPKQVLSPQDKGFLLNTKKQKIELLKKLGVDYFFEIKFDRDFSTLNPDYFLNNYIFNNKNLKEIYLGYDFSFGANKKGSYDLVKALADPKKILVSKLEALKKDEKVISSSLIRNYLNEGKLAKANSLLGYNYRLKGRIIKGVGRGKKIGFPTANISNNPYKLIPSEGVYISLSRLGKSIYHSVTNIGKNPTFGDIDAIQVETHLLNFDRDIYGEELEIEFCSRLRGEIKFSSVNELLDQISRDIDSAIKFFKPE